MTTLPLALTPAEWQEIVELPFIRECWGLDADEDWATFSERVYGARFDFNSGSPGYCGDLYFLQGDYLTGDPPIALIRDPRTRQIVVDSPWYEEEAEVLTLPADPFAPKPRPLDPAVEIVRLGEEGGWTCPCGNRSHAEGFFPCDREGVKMESDRDSVWDALYVCGACGRIIDQRDHAVVGQRTPDPDSVAPSGGT